jgi:7-keto-8-aminopelargonate synthetase-like enzyme
VPEANVNQMTALLLVSSCKRGSSNVALNRSSTDHLYSTSVSALLLAVAHSVLKMMFTDSSVTVNIWSNPHRMSWPGAMTGNSSIDVSEVGDGGT